MHWYTQVQSLLAACTRRFFFPVSQLAFSRRLVPFGIRRPRNLRIGAVCRPFAAMLRTSWLHIAHPPRSASITDHCIALRFLDIGAFTAVNDDVLELIARSPLGSTLHTLILSHCVDVSAPSIRTLGDQCTLLVCLPQLNDAGLAACAAASESAYKSSMFLIAPT